MNHKSQRIRIVEPGWINYTGNFGGVEFVNSLSAEIVDSATSARLGSLIRIQLVDSDQQAGIGAELQRIEKAAAPVVKDLEAALPSGSSTPATPPAPKHTREALEAIADKNGIAGLRAIADNYSVKGRGIAELISEILTAQDRG